MPSQVLETEHISEAVTATDSETLLRKSTLFKLLHLLGVQNNLSLNESKAKNTAYPRHGNFNPSER